MFGLISKLKRETKEEKDYGAILTGISERIEKDFNTYIYTIHTVYEFNLKQKNIIDSQRKTIISLKKEVALLIKKLKKYEGHKPKHNRSRRAKN